MLTSFDAFRERNEQCKYSATYRAARGSGLLIATEKGKFAMDQRFTDWREAGAELR
jgi:hypothetical protein